MRKFWLSLIVLTILFAGISFGQGPLTNALNLMVRTDSNGSLYVYGTVAGAQGPLTNLGNIRLRTYAPGSLAVTVAGGTISPDKVLLADGTAAAPSLAFTSNTGTGIYSISGNTLAFAAQGTGYASIQTNGLFLIQNAYPITFGAAFDTSITRLAAKSIGIGDGGVATGIELNAGTPTLGTCTGGSLTSGSHNFGGEVTGNTSGSCVLNFGTPNFINTPFCMLNDESSLTAVRISARSTSSITITGVPSGEAVQYLCIGRIGV